MSDSNLIAESRGNSREERFERHHTLGVLWGMCRSQHSANVVVVLEGNIPQRGVSGGNNEKSVNEGSRSQYGRDRRHKKGDAFKTYRGVGAGGGSRNLQCVEHDELDRGEEFKDAKIPQPGCYPQFIVDAMSNKCLT